jgi:hypothetical protein
MSDKLVLTSNAPIMGMLPQVDADGVATQTISIQKCDADGNPVTGTETVYVAILCGAVAAAAKTLQLVNGQASFVVGPTTLPQTPTVSVANSTVGLSGQLPIRFF